MKTYLLLLLLLLPLCSGGSWRTRREPTLKEEEHVNSTQKANFTIQCYGEDFIWVRNMLLDCNSEEEQACYTRDTGEKGCTLLKRCSNPGWQCCHTNGCNAKGNHTEGSNITT